MFSFGDEMFINIEEPSSEPKTTEVLTVHEDHHKDSAEHQDHHDDKDHSDDNDCEDECHFCVCTCLSHNLINPIFRIDFASFEYASSKKQNFYISLYSNNYLDTLLRPPQV